MRLFQLFGTVFEYVLDQRQSPPQGDLVDWLDGSRVQGILVTKTIASARAQRISRALGIELRERVGLDSYPMVKCNISQDGAKIYHLPVDQQYDRVRVDYARGEFYCLTAAEAESKGLRRAFRWRVVAKRYLRCAL